jgi:hypothetical protein
VQNILHHFTTLLFCHLSQTHTGLLYEQLTGNLLLVLHNHTYSPAGSPNTLITALYLPGVDALIRVSLTCCPAVFIKPG